MHVMKWVRTRPFPLYVLMIEEAYHPRAARPTVTAAVAPTLSVYNVDLAMPSILDLSDELPDHIVRVVPPFDLLSLALSEKCLHALAEKVLKQQLASQQEYSVLSFCIDTAVYLHPVQIGTK